MTKNKKKKAIIKMQEEILSGRTSVNSLDTDYKAEVVAASLIEQGYDPERVMIIRDGIFRRGISTEVEKIYQEYSDFDLVDYLCIRTNKEGMYDMLPQGLFHQPINRYAVKDKEDIVVEIKIHRTEEFFAILFYLQIHL